MSTLIEIGSKPIAGGVQKHYSHESTVTKCVMKFMVFFPFEDEENSDSDVNNNVNQSDKLPVLYYLVGYQNDETTLSQLSYHRHAKQHNLIIVCPDASPRNTGISGEFGDPYCGSGASGYVNASQPKWKGHFQMFDYITQELPSLIESSFPIVDGKRKGIAGHSIGGHGAIMTALKKPGFYKSVSALSPPASLMATPQGQRAFSNYFGFNRKLWTEWDALELIRCYKGLPLDILIDQGSKDDLLKTMLHSWKLIESSVGTNISIDYRLQAGYDHSYERFVRMFIGDHIAYHAKLLENKVIKLDLSN